MYSLVFGYSIIKDNWFQTYMLSLGKRSKRASEFIAMANDLRSLRLPIGTSTYPCIRFSDFWHGYSAGPRSGYTGSKAIRRGWRVSRHSSSSSSSSQSLSGVRSFSKGYLLSPKAVPRIVADAFCFLLPHQAPRGFPSQAS